MNKLLVLLCLTCLVNLSVSDSSIEDAFKTLDCISQETFKNLATSVLDFYYNKSSSKVFQDTFIGLVKDEIVTALQCVVQLVKKYPLKGNSAFTKIGYTFLLASNCEKDVGATLVILDVVLASLKNIKTEWKNLIFGGISTALLGKQSYEDCKNSIEMIKNIWKN
jgi:hypothetical protein